MDERRPLDMSAESGMPIALQAPQEPSSPTLVRSLTLLISRKMLRSLVIPQITRPFSLRRGKACIEAR